MANLSKKAADSLHLLDQMQLYPLGEAAWVIELGLAEQARLLQLRDLLAAADGISSVIVGVGNLTVRFNPLQITAAEAAQRLQQVWQAVLSVTQVAPQRQIIELPVHYGGEAGPDLLAVAQYCGLSVDEVITRHTAAIYSVVCIGFLPGFPYLMGLDPRLNCPRLAQPRVAVPAGSVGIGGAQTGIYPSNSPGGWQLIGHCALPLFDAQNQPPSRFQAGDLLRFIAI